MFIHNEIRKNLSLFSDICKNHGIKNRCMRLDLR